MMTIKNVDKSWATKNNYHELKLKVLSRITKEYMESIFGHAFVDFQNFMLDSNKRLYDL